MGIDGGTALALAVLLALVLLGALLWRLIEAPRRRRFGEFAASRGWRYVPSDRRLTEQLYGGRSLTCRHFITGEHRGHRVRVFEVEESVFVNPPSYRRHWIASVIDLPTAPPRLAVVERTRPGRRGRRPPAEQVSEVAIPDERFQRRFVVGAEDPALATEVLHPQLVAMLLGWPDVPTWGLHPRMLYVRSEGSLDLALIERRLDQACAIFDAIPDRVWRRAAEAAEDRR